MTHKQKLPFRNWKETQNRTTKVVENVQTNSKTAVKKLDGYYPLKKTLYRAAHKPAKKFNTNLYGQPKKKVSLPTYRE